MRSDDCLPGFAVGTSPTTLLAGRLRGPWVRYASGTGAVEGRPMRELPEQGRERPRCALDAHGNHCTMERLYRCATGSRGLKYAGLPCGLRLVVQDWVS